MAITDTLPSTSWLHTYARPQDYLDCFSVEIDNRWAREVATMPEVANLLFSIDVMGMARLMRLRDMIVKPIGLKTADSMSTDTQAPSTADLKVGDRISFARIYNISENEIILGEDDRHQDFRVALMRVPENPGRFFASTCCRRHNRFGHFYLATILPFHNYAVKGMLDGAAEMLAGAGDSPVHIAQARL